MYWREEESITESSRQKTPLILLQLSIIIANSSHISSKKKGALKSIPKNTQILLAKASKTNFRP